MKRFLAYLLVAVSLLLSGNAFSNEIYLHCKSYKTESVYTEGGMKEEKDQTHEEFIKINAKKKKIYTHNDLSNSFYEHRNIKWGESKIQWKDNFPDRINNYELNRLNLEYLWETKYENDEVYRFLRSFYNCKIEEKKF